MPKRHVEKFYTDESQDREGEWRKLALMLLETPGSGVHERCDFGQFGPPSEHSHKAQAAVEDFVDELIDIANGTGFLSGELLDLETRERAAMAVCRIFQTNALHLSPQVDNPCPTCGASESSEHCTVTLTNVGLNKINVIKVVREVTGLGLKEAKDLVESAPKPVKEGVPKAKAEALKKQFEAVGATVEIR